jgi:hypothetical protein
VHCARDGLRFIVLAPKGGKTNIYCYITADPEGCGLWWTDFRFCCCCCWDTLALLLLLMLLLLAAAE